MPLEQTKWLDAGGFSPHERAEQAERYVSSPALLPFGGLKLRTVTIFQRRRGLGPCVHAPDAGMGDRAQFSSARRLWPCHWRILERRFSLIVRQALTLAGAKPFLGSFATARHLQGRFHAQPFRPVREAGEPPDSRPRVLPR
jgi:hypothetical protein